MIHMHKTMAILFICLLCIGLTSYGSVTNENPTNGNQDRYSQKFLPNSKTTKKAIKKNNLKNKTLAICSTQLAKKMVIFICDLISDEKKFSSKPQLFVFNNNSSSPDSNDL